VARLHDGSRKVTHVTEVDGFDLDTHKYVLRDLFVRKYSGTDDSGKLISELVPTGALPACSHQLDEHGVVLPDAMLERAGMMAEPH